MVPVPPNVSLFSLLSIYYCRLLAGSIAAFYGTGVLVLVISLSLESMVGEWQRGT
jgi:hypothetical protein